MGSGVDYMYLDSSVGSWQMSQFMVNTSQGAIANTLNQLYKGQAYKVRGKSTLPFEQSTMVLFIFVYFFFFSPNPPHIGSLVSVPTGSKLVTVCWIGTHVFGELRDIYLLVTKGSLVKHSSGVKTATYLFPFLQHWPLISNLNQTSATEIDW